MEVGRFHSRQDPLDRDHILIPEVLADDFTTDLGQLLKPAFDIIWNAFDYPGSAMYGEDGKRIHRESY